MNKLNGWQRLWVLAATIYAFCVATLVLANWPSETTSYRSVRGQCTPLVLSLQNQMRENDGLPALTKAECHAEELATQRRAEKESQEARAELPGRRFDAMMGGIVLWVVGTAGTYLLGWLIAWVRRGFKEGSGAMR